MSGDSHTYELMTKEDQYVFGSVTQSSVDVMITVMGPDGERIGQYNNSARGPERVQFKTSKAGLHLMRVSPFAPYAEEEGEYSVGIFRQEQLADTAEGKVDQWMSAYEEDMPGWVVAVVRGGDIVFSRSYGLANVEYGVPNSISTPYHMASVSKQFTAMAIVILSQQGLVGLDDDVRKYLPDLPDFGNTVTLRHLLNHTSGIRDHWTLWVMSGGRMDDVIRQQDLMRLVVRQKEMNFEPGEEYLYSNTGYLLLSEVVSTVSGKPFGEWMTANVFAPLGMNSTQIYDDHERIVPGRAYSYQYSNNGLSKAVLSYANSGATSLFTTAEDLAKWLSNFHSGQVGGRAAIEQLQVQGVLNDGETIDYALGIDIDEHNGLRRLSHGGADAGFRTWLAYYPEIDAGVVALGNEGSHPVVIGDAVAEAFFSDYMSLQDESTNEQDTDSPSQHQTPETVANAVAGVFAIQDGSYIQFFYDYGVLFAEWEGQWEPSFVMLRLDDYEFRIDVPGDEITVRFDLTSEGVVNTATLFQNGEKPMRRIDDWKPNAEELAAYTGRYYSDELETFYSVALDGEELTIHHIRHGDFPLVPKEKGVFSSGEWFIGTVTFESDEGGVSTTLRMSNGPIRNLRFERVN